MCAAPSFSEGFRRSLVLLTWPVTECISSSLWLWCMLYHTDGGSELCYIIVQDCLNPSPALSPQPAAIITPPCLRSCRPSLCVTKRRLPQQRASSLLTVKSRRHRCRCSPRPSYPGTTFLRIVFSLSVMIVALALAGPALALKSASFYSMVWYRGPGVLGLEGIVWYSHCLPVTATPPLHPTPRPSRTRARSRPMRGMLSVVSRPATRYYHHSLQHSALMLLTRSSLL